MPCRSLHSRSTKSPGTRQRKATLRRVLRLRIASGTCFLSENKLLSEAAPALPDGALPDEFALHSSHLNALGLQVMKAGYDRWLKAIDRGTAPEKAGALSSALAKALGTRA